MSRIIVNLPRDCEFPMELDSFNRTENLVMILVGIEAVKAMKENFVNKNDDYDHYLQKELSKKEEQNVMLKTIYDGLIIEERERQSTKLIELVTIEKKRIAMEYKEIIEKYDKDNDKYQDKIEKLHEIVTLSKNDIYDLQMELVKKNERDLLRDLHQDLEINMKVKDREDELNKALEKHKDLFNQAEKDFMITENNSKLLEKNKIDMLNAELSETKEKLNNLLIHIEKEKNMQLNEILEKSLLDNSKIITNKSNLRGTLGERFLQETVLNAFKDFEHFELIDKSKQPHCGDLWLIINSIIIMCDSKNYKDTFVPKSEIDKLRSDIQFNKTIKIAWLISMDKPILKYSNAPFIIDVIDNVIYCFINSLMTCLEPEKLLISAYFQCKYVYDNLINIKSDESMVAKYEKNEARTRIILKKILDGSKERFGIINSLKEQFTNIDIGLRDILNEEVKYVEQNNISIFQDWWNLNIMKSETRKLKTNDVYKKFISSEINKNHGIDGDMMKQIIKSFLTEKDIIQGLTSKAQFTILGYDYIVLSAK